MSQADLIAFQPFSPHALALMPEVVAAAKADCIRFADDFVWMVDYETRPARVYKFLCRPWQADAFRDWQSERESPLLEIDLKSRGVGASTAAVIFGTWLPWARPPAQVIFESDIEDKAFALMRRHKFIVLRLPAALGYPRPSKQGTDNLSARVFPDGSEILSLSGDPENIRMHHPTFIFIDEAAKFRADFRPALVGVKSDVVIASTADGLANPFADIWQDAYSADGEEWGYRPRFISWRDRGDLTERPKGDPKVIAQEYPDTPEEAFAASAGRVFTAFSKERNVCAPFAIPPDWPTIRGHDPGVRGVGWVWTSVARDVAGYVDQQWPGLPEGITEGARVTWACWQPRELTTEQQVAGVWERDRGRPIRYTAMDPSDPRQQTGKGLRKVSELLVDAGLRNIFSAPNGEAAFIRKAQSDFTYRQHFITSDCAELIDQLEKEQYKRVGSEEEAREGEEKRQFSKAFHVLAAWKYDVLSEPETLWGPPKPEGRKGTLEKEITRMSSGTGEGRAMIRPS